jgi:hypothetical protein
MVIVIEARDGATVKTVGPPQPQVIEHEAFDETDEGE